MEGWYYLLRGVKMNEVEGSSSMPFDADVVGCVINSWTHFTRVSAAYPYKLNSMMKEAVLYAIKYVNTYMANKRVQNDIYDDTPENLSVNHLIDCENPTASAVNYAKRLIKIYDVPRKYVRGYAGKEELEALDAFLQQDAIVEDGIYYAHKDALLCLIECLYDSNWQANHEKDIYEIIHSRSYAGNEKSIVERVSVISNRSFNITEEDAECLNRYSFFGPRLSLQELSNESLGRLFSLMADYIMGHNSNTYAISLYGLKKFLERGKLPYVRNLILNTVLSSDKVSDKIRISFVTRGSAIEPCVEITGDKVANWIDEIGEKGYYCNREKILDMVNEYLFN